MHIQPTDIASRYAVPGSRECRARTLAHVSLPPNEEGWKGSELTIDTLRSGLLELGRAIERW